MFIVQPGLIWEAEGRRVGGESLGKWMQRCPVVTDVKALKTDTLQPTLLPLLSPLCCSQAGGFIGNCSQSPTTISSRDF